ncbi:MAG: hypothetical protein MZV70_35160 [Desulfobacterales bacterium]|nr:hypothetical protein [Desulfobacterales bacterium]
MTPDRGWNRGGALTRGGLAPVYPAAMATVDDKKIIYSMDRVSKRHGTKQVLKDISPQLLLRRQDRRA